MKRLRSDRKRQRNSSKRRGAAVTEFAIIAPLFFLLVMGCIEFGRALMVQQVITNASRVGARAATMLNGTESEAVSAATDYASGATVAGVSVTVSPSPSAASTGDPITVDVTVPFASVSWTPAPWFLEGMTLSASSVMRKEGFE